MIQKVIVFAFFLLICSGLFSQDKELSLQDDSHFSVSLELGYFYPMDYYRFLLNSGPFAGASVNYQPFPQHLLFFKVEGGAAFSDFQNAGDVSYLFLPLGFSTSYGFELFKDFDLIASAGGGFYFFTIAEEQFRNWFTKAGLEFKYHWTYHLQSSIKYSTYYLNDAKKALWASNFSLSMDYVFGNPYAEKDLKVVKVSIDEIFGALYPLYHKKSLGALRIKNTAAKAISDISVSFYLKGFMEGKTNSGISHPLLLSGKEVVLPIYALFSKELIRLKTKQQKTGIIELRYKKGGKIYTKKQTVGLTLHSKNALVWSRLNRLGSFISSSDPAVANFARKLIRLVPESQGREAFSEDFKNVLRIITGLKLYGIRYVKDPGTPYKTFSYQTAMTDFVQYPRETLIAKTGDCDDLTVLLAALLESVGIRTALITQPGHIFLLVAVDDQGLKRTVRFQEKNWIPIETTIINQGFFKAWKQGYATYRGGQTESVKTSLEATSEYPPLLFEEKLNILISLNEDAFQKTITWEWGKILKENISESKKASSPQELNQQGIAHARKKEYEQAEKVFLEVLKKDKNYSLAYYNLIHIYGILNNKEKALSLYKQFFEIFRRDEKMEGLMKRYGFIENEKNMDVIRSF